MDLITDAEHPCPVSREQLTLTQVLPDLATSPSLDPSHLTTVDKKRAWSHEAARLCQGWPVPGLPDSESASLSFKKRGPPIRTAECADMSPRACPQGAPGVPLGGAARGAWLSQPEARGVPGTSTWATVGTPSRPPGSDADAQQGKGEASHLASPSH